MVGRHGEAEHRGSPLPDDRARSINRSHIPSPDRRIVTRGVQKPAVVRESHVNDRVLAAINVPIRPQSRGVPEPDRAVAAGCGEHLAVGSEGQVVDPRFVAEQHPIAVAFVPEIVPFEPA